MKPSKFTDEQILAIVREGGAGRRERDQHGVSLRFIAPGGLWTSP